MEIIQIFQTTNQPLFLGMISRVKLGQAVKSHEFTATVASSSLKKPRANAPEKQPV